MDVFKKYENHKSIDFSKISLNDIELYSLNPNYIDDIKKLEIDKFQQVLDYYYSKMDGTQYLYNCPNPAIWIIDKTDTNIRIKYFDKKSFELF